MKAEIEAFQKGLNELVPDELMSIFDENELEVSIFFTVFDVGTNIFFTKTDLQFRILKFLNF